MANWSVLKAAVANIINTNGNQAITGQLLQNVLNNIITNVGENSAFAGIATVDTNPGAPDGPVFYLTATAGVYPNFNSLEVLDGEAIIFEWDNGTWSKKLTGFATQEKLTNLQKETDEKLSQLGSKTKYLISNVSGVPTEIARNVIPIGDKLVAGRTYHIEIAFDIVTGLISDIGAGKSSNTYPTDWIARKVYNNSGKISVDYIPSVDVTDFFVVMNSSFVYDANSSVKILTYEGLQDKITRMNNNITEIGTYCYFQAGWNPSINITKEGEVVSVSVDLSSISDNRQMRIVKEGGDVLYTIVDGELYNLSNAEKLVFDTQTKAITKVPYNAEGNYVLLLAVNGESISGILAPYYLRNVQKIDYLEKYHFFGGSYVDNVHKDYVLAEGVRLKKGHTYRFYLSSADTVTMSADTNLKIRTKTNEKTIVGTADFNGKVLEAGKEEISEVVWNFDDVDDYCVAIRFSASPFPIAYLKLRIEDVTADDVYSRTSVGGKYLQWEMGSLQGEDGNPYDSSTRVRTSFIKVSKGDSIIGLGELTYYVYFYSENKTFDNSIGWVSGVTTVQNDGYIRIIRRHEDNSVISDTDVENLAKGITLESSYNTIQVLLDKLNTTKENLYCLIQSGYKPNFIFSNKNGEGSMNISFDSKMRGKHIRIYFIGVGEVADYVLTGDENFTVNNGQSLVLDKDNGVLKVVPVSEVGDYYLLFTSAASGFAYSGLLYPYYAASSDTYVLNVQKDSVAKKGSVAYKTTSAYGNGSCDLKFIHFSDIHGLSEKVQRMIEVSNSLGNEYVDFILNTGDVVTFIQSDGLDWYNAVLNTSNKDVLTCIGNHDAWSADDTVNQDRTVAYGLITEPLVSKVEGIIQPSNASSQGLNYWYKDYVNIRLIAIDCIYWDSAQATWFSSVLAEAKGLGLEVICVSHAPFDLQYMDIIENKWSSLCEYFQDATITPIQAAELVSNFIDDGGKFISWFVGHTHRDYVIKLKDDYNNQPVMVVGSGRNDKVADIVKSDNKADYSYDLFNYVGIDCTNKVIKIVRIGADTDYFMRRRISLCFKYDEGRIIAD